MKNLGGIDRKLRVLGGALLLALTFMGPFADVLFPWGLIGAVPLFTGLIGWCPAYSLFGLKTCSTCG